MNTGVKERIALTGGQAYRLLRWSENVNETEVVLSRHMSVRFVGEGERWHFHQACELTYFREGEGTRFVGDHMAKFGPGELVLIGENLPHYWHTRGKSSGLCVQWDFPPGHSLWTFPESQKLAVFFKSAARGIHFIGTTARNLAAQMHEMATNSPLARLGILLRILDTATAAPAHEFSFLSTLPLGASATTRHQLAMREAMQYLLARFRDDVRLDRLLQLTQMSKPTFSREFKKCFGKSFNQFLQQLRLDAASQELSETDHPIIDVALSSGFSQISFFNRAFRRAFRCSPSDYRRQKREGAA